MQLWIGLIMILVFRPTSSQSSEMELLISDLSKNLSKAFADVRIFLNADDIASKIKTKSKPIDKQAAIDILKKSKLDTETLVLQTSEVVDNIQSKLTTDFEEYANTPPVEYNIDCGPKDYMFYFRSKALRNGPYDFQNCTFQHLPFVNDSLLGNIKTNRQNSTVHVPTNVFDSSKEIQNVANYTNNIDQTFALSEHKPQIKWQFFCSNTGFFKIFPGIRWNIQIEDMEKDNTKVDFYDCRSEQWFLESTSYPKKMIIMVDKSGSMKGRRRIIANHTIYEILNTITENDYFNVILFNKEVLIGDNKTMHILMQATEKNKRFIMKELDTIFIPDGIAEYDVGLNASFQILQNERDKENGTTIYNYLLMIITDGSPLPYQEIIDDRNKDIKARIFTYLIGQGSTEREVVKHMACKNRGYAVEIATLADVKENVQKYLNVVARPNAIMQNNFHVWTGVHQYQMRPSIDLVHYTLSNMSSLPLGMTSTMSYVTNISQMTTSASVTMTMQPNMSMLSPPIPTKIEVTKPESLQMFVTVSKAVYDVTNETAQKNLGILIGAAGVDVPISDFTKTAPFWKIGVNSYLFGVTHNGFVIFHPRYRPLEKQFVKYFYRNVDISELEIAVEDYITEILPNQTIPSSLRDRIIRVEPEDQPEFVEVRSTYDIVDDYKTAFKTQRDYFITGIQRTSYKFGLAIPVNTVVSEYANLKEFNNMDLSVFSTNFKNNASFCNISTSLANEAGLALKDYELCNLNQKIAELMLMSPLCALREVIINDNLRAVCLQKPDGKNTPDSVLETYLKSLYNEADDTKHLPIDWNAKTNVALNIGAQQVFSMHHFGLIRYFNYRNLSYEQFIADNNAAIEGPLYQETVLTSQLLSNPGVIVVRPLPNNVVKKTMNENLLVLTVTTPIVTGSEYKGIVGVQLDQQFYLKTLMNSPCTTGKCLSCSNSTVLDCYVITGSGVVVLNNQNVGNTGELLKEIDCKLMESLVNGGIFKSQSLYDFQALCTTIPKVESFANMLTDPFTKMFRLSMWLIYELLILVQNLSLTSLVWSFSYQEETEQFSELPKPSFDNGDIKIPVFSTESSLKQLGILSPLNRDTTDEMNAPKPKSKRQHELFVKNTLEEKIGYCKKNNLPGETEFSGCIQKAVTDICKLDKTHNGKQTDQHVEKLTSLNTISHCITVCLILQSDYPSIWQEQDDCRQPNNMCRTVTQTFTSIYPSSKLIHGGGGPVKEATQPDPAQPTYFQYQQQIVTNEDSIVLPVYKQPTTSTILNGTICKEICPAKTWYATGIENTNLILVIVHKMNAACTCECKTSFGLKIEIERNISYSIENPLVQRPNYFSQFVPFTKEENSTECSDDAAPVTMPLRWMITIPVLLLLSLMG